MKIDGKHIGLRRVRSGEVTPDLTAELQTIGLKAWSHGLRNTRDREEVGYYFGPHTYEAAHKRFKSFARHGSLVVATALCNGSKPIGYAMVRNDVSGGLLERMAKRVASREHVYAWLAQINVDADYQSHGIGTQLLARTLETFPGEQQPTAYIFDENTLALRWFKRVGFELNPDPQAPREDVAYAYFGPNNSRVDQRRYAAPDVRTVLQIAQSKLAQYSA